MEKVCYNGLPEEKIVTLKPPQTAREYGLDSLKKIYTYRGLSSDLKQDKYLKNDFRPRHRKIQDRAGNCVVQSWEVGQEIRLKNWDLYKWLKHHARHFATDLFKIIPKMDMAKLLLP